MNRAELVRLMKEKGSYPTIAEAEKALRTFTDTIEELLIRKESVSLIGFGSFESVLQKGRKGTIPGTDKQYKTEDKYTPRFKASKALKVRVATGE